MTAEDLPTWNSPTTELTALEAGLTGAAREALDRYVRDLRIRIVREALRGPRTSARIDSTEMTEAIGRIQAADHLVPRSTSDLLGALARPLALRIIASVIGGLAVLGLFAVLNDQGGWPPVVAGVAGGALLAAGAVASVIFVFELSRSRRWRAEHQSIIASREFVRSLANVEDSSLTLAARLVGAESGKAIGLRGAHVALEERGVWSSEDVNTFRRLLRLRNRIVHGDALALSDNDQKYAMAELSRLWELLRIPAVAVPTD